MNKINFLLLIIFTLPCFLSLDAQDIITLKTGEEISSKIVEVGLNEVKYKKYDNQAGPVYTLMKSDVFMIKYENGSKDIFSTTTPAAKPDQNNNGSGNQDNTVKKQVEQGIHNYAMQNDYDKNMALFHKKMTKGIVETSIGVSFMAIGGGILGYGVSRFNADNTYNNINGLGPADDGYIDNTTDIVLMSVGAAILAAGIPLSIIGPVQLGRSFHYKKLAKKSKASMSFEPTLLRAPGAPMNSTCGLGVKVHF